MSVEVRERQGWRLRYVFYYEFLLFTTKWPWFSAKNPIAWTIKISDLWLEKDEYGVHLEWAIEYIAGRGWMATTVCVG